jgi:signal transduction histidine kinase
MSAAATLGGWVAAAVGAATMIALRRMLGSRMEAVARACHELRGPLTAARLGLSFGARCGELSADRLRAIDTELGRATLALQDLADLRQGGSSWAPGSSRPGTVRRYRCGATGCGWRRRWAT